MTQTSESDDQFTDLKANIFEGAHEASESWETFDWHRGPDGKWDMHKKHSSQALAIDLFGTIKVIADRDVVLDQIVTALGLPAGGPWNVELEWRVPKSLLNERRPTQIDAVAK